MRIDNRLETDMIEQLKSEVEIPQVVQTRVNDTFDKIKNESSGIIQMPKKKIFSRMNKMAACIAVGVLTCGVITAGAAAYYHWNKGLEDYFQVEEKEKEKIEESGVADFPDLCVTDNGVTVTVEESLVDNYFAFVTLKVEGLEVPEKMQPEFATCDYSIGNYDFTSCCGGFYNGTIMGEDGKVKLADGSEMPVDEDGSLLFNYTMEDGSLSYHLLFYSEGEKGYFLNQPIHIELADLGFYGENQEVDVVVEGNWNFDWTLSGSQDTLEVDCNEALGESGASLVHAEISPISIYAMLDYPYKETTEPGIDVNGNAFEHKTYVEPPYLVGVKLKDGTRYTRLLTGGMEGYLEDKKTFFYLFSTDRILDLKQIDSLLFIKSYPEGEGPLTEENLYEVKVQ